MMNKLHKFKVKSKVIYFLPQNNKSIALHGWYCVGVYLYFLISRDIYDLVMLYYTTISLFLYSYKVCCLSYDYIIFGDGITWNASINFPGCLASLWQDSTWGKPWTSCEQALLSLCSRWLQCLSNTNTNSNNNTNTNLATKPSCWYSIKLFQW